MMKLITFQPIAFLLKLSVSDVSFSKTKGIRVVSTNKKLSLLEGVIVAFKSKQESIGFSISKVGFFNFKNKISNNILVGKDKSVVTNCNMIGPTPSALQKLCYD
ncbi:MAG: hypothetical protein L3J14_02645 [Flavobacteriaceae bacterium]|nr:hypothetical protein [Flavobacteriaceae bacterium]